MHPDANTRQRLCTCTGVSPPPEAPKREGATTSSRESGRHRAGEGSSSNRASRAAGHSRTQAAAALGISRSTFDRRVLPLIDTIEMPWGTQLIPVDELERLLAEHRSRARRQVTPPARPGRRAAVGPNIVERIRAEHAACKSLGEIARDLTAAKVPTAHGGRQWWPSTVRAVLLRAAGGNGA